MAKKLPCLASPLSRSPAVAVSVSVWPLAPINVGALVLIADALAFVGLIREGGGGLLHLLQMNATTPSVVTLSLSAAIWSDSGEEAANKASVS